MEEVHLAWWVVKALAYEPWREGAFLKHERLVGLRREHEHPGRVQEKLRRSP